MAYEERYNKAVATKTYADATRHGPIYAEFMFRAWDYYNDNWVGSFNWLDCNINKFKEWVEKKHQLELKAAKDTMQSNNLSVDQAAEIFSRDSCKKDYCIKWWKDRL